MRKRRNIRSFKKRRSFKKPLKRLGRRIKRYGVSRGGISLR